MPVSHAYEIDAEEVRKIFERYSINQQNMNNPFWAPSLHSASLWYTLNVANQSLRPDMLTTTIPYPVTMHMAAINKIMEEKKSLAVMAMAKAMENQGIYSRKIFIGGLPHHSTGYAISEVDIVRALSKYGIVSIDWPYKDEYNDVPPNGFAFGIFETEQSVHELLNDCTPSANGYVLKMYANDHGSYSRTLVQIRPWICAEKVWINKALNEEDASRFDRFSTFVGGVPRVITAERLANIITQKLGHVVAVEIETDRSTNYPKGAARVVFSTRESYVIALARRHLSIDVLGIVKEIEIKPYLSDRFCCDNCAYRGGKFFCSELPCLKYLCQECWGKLHYGIDHQPMSRGTYYRPLFQSNYMGKPVYRDRLPSHTERTSTASEAPVSSSGCSSRHSDGDHNNRNREQRKSL